MHCCPEVGRRPLVASRRVARSEPSEASTGMARRGSPREAGRGRVDRANRRAWQDWGRIDPMWAIVTDPERDHSRWEVDQFFASGQATVDDLWQVATGLGLPARSQRGLDLGCGVGRLTRALGAHVDTVLGLDISRSMVDRARRFHEGYPNLAFAVHERDDLADFADGSFDVVCCLLVLQHLPSMAAIERYLHELVRVLAPGGLLMLQLTTSLPAAQPATGLRARVRLRTRLGGVLRAVGVGPAMLASLLGWRPPMTMTAVADERARMLLTAAGGRVVWACPRDLGHGEQDCLYLVTA